MKQEEIQELIDLRASIILAYNKLDGRTSPNAAIVRQTDVAVVYESCIRKLDNILGEYVKFS